MTARQWQPAGGDEVVELRRGTQRPDTIGEVVRVRTVTKTLVITTDGAKYNRAGLFPTHEGRGSARILVPVTDDRVLCVRGRDMLRTVAQVASNLACVHTNDPMVLAGGLAQIINRASALRQEFIDLAAAASRARQEGER